MAVKKPEDMLAETIRSAMGRRNLSRTDLAERMNNLGYPKWSRQAVTEAIEGRRRILAGELYPLSFALELPLPALMMPWTESGPAEIELPSGMRIRYSIETKAPGPYAGLWNGNTPNVAQGNTFNETYILDESPRRIQQPVVAAIVTSPLGVLIGHRNDRTPPWTFIAGEAEPREQPADTIIREVKEETGLEIEAGETIGTRVHPATGRTMVYMTGRPVRGTAVIVGDEAELDDVRWADLHEALEAMPDMYEPVRAYLERELGEAGET